MRDLLLTIDSSLGRRAGLEHGLRTAIRSDQLSVGQQLPSSRALACDLGYARSTIVAAYEQLVIEGYLTARTGQGTVVAGLPPTPATGPSSAVGSPALPLHDFRPGQGDGSLFPRTAWLRSVRRTLTHGPDDLFAYPHPAGRPELRRSLAEYLGRSRAVVASAEAVSVFNGATPAAALLSELFASLGHTTIAVEDPSLFLLRDALKAGGTQPVPVPMDGEGLDIGALCDTGARVVVVTPAHQFPTGITMSAERRAALVRWAHQTNGWIIEDDYDGEYRYDRRPGSACRLPGPR